MRFVLMLALVLGLAFFAVKSCGSKLLGGKPSAGGSVTSTLTEGATAAVIPGAEKKESEEPKQPQLCAIYVFRNRVVPPVASFSAWASGAASSGDKTTSLTVTTDPFSNSVLVRGTPAELDAFMLGVRAMDVEATECYCDAWMVFVQGDKLEDFEASLSFGGFDPTSSLSLSNSGIGVVVPAGNVQLAFNAMKSSGLLEVMDRPQIRLSSGIPSEVSTGEEVPFPSVTLNNFGGSSTGIEFKRVGLSFKVTPLFLPGNRVRLDINAENGLLGAIQKIGNIEVPSITRQTVTTSATLGYDDAVIVGGLESVRKEKRFGLLGEKEKLAVGRLYVALVLRSGVARALPADLSQPDPAAEDFDGSLLPPKGWTWKGLNAEINRMEKGLIRGRPASK